MLKDFFKKTHYVDNQLDPYNNFINHEIQAIIDRESTIFIYSEKDDCEGDTDGCAKSNSSTGLNSPNLHSSNEQQNFRGKPIMLIKFGKVYVSRPTFISSDRVSNPLFPNEARNRNISYDGTIFATIRINNLETNQISVYDQISIGKIPVMIRSDICNLSHYNNEISECSNDHGGYFIIKGKERVLVSQLRRAYNKVYVEHNPEEKYDYTAEIRSMTSGGNSILIQLKYNNITGELMFSLPYIKTLIPAGVVFRALNVSESDMLSYVRIKKPDHVIRILKKQFNIQNNSEEAIQCISNYMNDETKCADYVKTIFLNELFCHIEYKAEVQNHKYKENDEKALQHIKAAHCGYMIKKLIETTLNIRAIDDKDSLSNKRLDSTSSLLGFLFQILFKQFVKTITNQLKMKKNPDPITTIRSINSITHGFNMSFMTGNWNVQKNSSFTRVGVSQVLSCHNYGARLSHLRRIMLPIGKKGKNSNVRQLHSSHFSFICPYETPEGDTVGIVSNLTLCTKTSTYSDNNEKTSRLIRQITATLQKDPRNQDTLILMNGVIVAESINCYEFVQTFNKFRQSDLVDWSTSMVWLREEREIHIQTDEGRFLRPVFLLDSMNRKIKFDPGKFKQAPYFSEKVSDENFVVVFRDAWELEHSVIAMSENYLTKFKCDYLEIRPSMTMMGGMASAIPLSNHSQSPRIAYQAAMGKQAIGIPVENFQHRYDTTLHVLDTPQKPITRSEMVSVLNFDKMPHGVNAIVAIMTYTGFNQEDSIILNKSSIDRGLFSVTTFKTIIEEERKRGNSDFDTICVPKSEYRNPNYDYSLLNENGLIYKLNVWLSKGTVIVGKTRTQTGKDENNEKKLITSDVSVVIRHGEEGYLSSILDTVTNDGVRIIKIRVRIPRIPQKGDKFASSTAQKGTCGMIYSEYDMPFDESGITPDIIINPHAIPSRMTINMQIEIAFNLAGCKLWREMDATPFDHNNIEQELEKLAAEAGISSYMSTMYCGMTGVKFPQKIFMGPCYYQRLKHMVVDKIHARVAGPLDTLTHQPVAGRARDGGLKFGEMEKDCMLSHGATRILKECLFDKSDHYTIPICSNCGAIPNNRSECTCSNSKVELKNMPYATKLLFQELIGMGLKIRIS